MIFKRGLVIFAIIISGTLQALPQNNIIYDSNIRTLQVVAGQQWLDMPIISLHGDDLINISFDDLSHTYRRMTYSLEHCEADWSTSAQLFSSDFIDGFAEGNTIEDVAESINTNILYTHYSLSLPNSKCRFKSSGNYKLNIIDDESGEKIVTACFMVLDPKVKLGMDVTANTDIDINKTHQQVGVRLLYGDLDVSDVDRQIKTVVLQNGRWDNAVWNAKPQYRNVKGLQWSHSKNLIFKAGNEYHKFESLSTNHTTLGIDKIRWDGASFHCWLYDDEPRRNYLYDEDANGAFYIRNSDNIDNDITSDYIYVHFSLFTDHIHTNDVFVNGMWTNGCFSDEYRMTYNNERNCYEKTILLKQGYYSYQYLMSIDNGKTDFLPTEGSFAQTENKYQILVYFKPLGGRTDQLVGYSKIQTNR